ncbi:MAG: ParA family protein [Pseudomonadota bacterium]
MTSKVGNQPRVIAVANQKGGVGKTTTAINLGTALAQAGFQCVIIDLDPQGNASTGLGCPQEERSSSMYEALSGELSLLQTLQPTPVEDLLLAPSSVDLSGADVELVDQIDRTHRLRNLLDQFFEDAQDAHVDYVLIDCPPSLNLLTVNAMVAAQSVLVPLQSEFFALEGLTQLLSTVKQVRQNLNPGLHIAGIVLTMFDQRNRLSGQVAEDVRENLGDVVFSTIIPRNVRISEAPSHAIPVLVYDPGCAGSIAYRALAQEVLTRDGLLTAA